MCVREYMNNVVPVLFDFVNQITAICSIENFTKTG